MELARLNTAKCALRASCTPGADFERALIELVLAVRADMRNRIMKNKGPQRPPRRRGGIAHRVAVGACGHRFLEPDCQDCQGLAP